MARKQKLPSNVAKPLRYAGVKRKDYGEARKGGWIPRKKAK